MLNTVLPKSPTFITRIEQAYESLSPNGRKVANYLQQNPLDVINTSVAEIAEITSTSKATVSRFFRQLGYDSHLDVKKELKSLREKGYPVVTEHTDNNFVLQELSRIQQTWENVKTEELEWLIDALVNASRVTLIGFRNSYPVALHFRQQLLQIRNKVRILPQPGQTIGEELLELADDELIIIVGFRRRPKVFPTLIEQLKGRNVVLLGDPSAQLYKSKVHKILICQLGQALALDSYAAPMSVISVICNAVLDKVNGSDHRVSRISELYQSLDELE